MKKEEQESGVIMIEAIYVVVIAIMVIFFVINVGVIYHNRIVVAAIADEAASGVAGIYGALDKEPFFAYMEEEDFKHINPYRYISYGSTFKDITEKKATWYASYLVYESDFTTNKTLPMPDTTVTCECSENEIGLKTLSVTIKKKYPIFIMNPVSFWGLDPEYEVEATGTAVCYDVIHQMNSIAFADEIQDKLVDNTIGECVTSMVGIITKIMQALGI